MEEKELQSIVEAVSKAVGSLNKPEPKEGEKEEAFECPECGSKVAARDVHCSGCGCELEWGE